ncbi:MAG: cupin domain-containing protein [Streptosporangiaceae bacterium]
MTASSGSAVVRTVLDTGGGLVRRQVVVPGGALFDGLAGAGGELWFVMKGTGGLTSGGGTAGSAEPVGPDTGVWLPPGTSYGLVAEGSGELGVDSVVLPGGTAEETAETGQTGEPLLSLLSECAVEVTGDRRFRLLFGPGRGCEAATQFVGEIPPGRAPVHMHIYDEVVLILAGKGVAHVGAEERPLTPGSCLHLAPGTPHCLENTGRDTLRVLGVFHPGGSPAAKRQT